MAEAIALVGVVAAATQFTEIGCSILLHSSTLFSRFHYVPQCLQRILNQIQLLLQLADLVSKKDVMQPLLKVPLSWQENVWKNCTTQARSLEKIIKSMLCETEDSHIRRIWKRILTLKREESINQIINEIESYKSMLNLWFGQECLDNIQLVGQTIVLIHGAQLARMENQINTIRSELGTISKDRAQVIKHRGAIQRKQPHPWRSLGLQREYCPEMTSITPRKTTVSYILACKCRLADSKYVIFFQRSGWLFRHRKMMHEGCPIHSRHTYSTEIAVRFRKRLAWLPGIVELEILVKAALGIPSIGISLQSEIRVEVLPVFSIFEKFCGTHLHEKKVCETESDGTQWFASKSVTKEKQEYLFSVARKILLQAYQSGTASPYDVDRQGRTLLHLIVQKCHVGDETFLSQMVRLLLSVGIRADALDDTFSTAQKGLAMSFAPRNWDSTKTWPSTISPINHTLVDWNSCYLPTFKCAIEILDCILRWPDSISDWGCPQICDIVIKRSMQALETYISKALHLKETISRQISPLHFATAGHWPQGIEFLLAKGMNRYLEDSCGHFPLDIAIKIQCVQAVGILLRGDNTPYFLRGMKYQRLSRPSTFLRAGLSNNEAIQDMVVAAWANQRHQFKAALPYHDLARSFGDVRLVAEKIFAAGFQNIEEYDEKGMTPLISACCYGSTSIIAFLLQKGGDLSRTHRDANLRAGHFLFFTANQFWNQKDFGYTRSDFLRSEDIATLLKAAFDIAECVDSRCRCSPEGFSPVVSSFKADEIEHFFVRKEVFKKTIRYLDLSENDLRKQWQCLVRMEIFHRLELTHTCIRQFPTIRKFPDDDRLEIEEEEEELYVQLRTLMNEYNEWQQVFDGDIVECVDIFFDRLDDNLRPRQGLLMWTPIWGNNDPDLLGPGRTIEKCWMSSRGELKREGHKEGVRESYVLQSLFS